MPMQSLTTSEETAMSSAEHAEVAACERVEKAGGISGLLLSHRYR